MLKSLLQITMRLGAAGVLLACFVIPTHATPSYFDQFYDCDRNLEDYYDQGTYFGMLHHCRTSPYYPYDPDENDCRYSAGNSFLNCLNGLPTPPALELDFCGSANAAFQDCLNEFGPNSECPDFNALWSCRTASGIDLCQ